MPTENIMHRALSKLQAAVLLYGPCPEDDCCGNEGCVAMRAALKEAELMRLGVYAVKTGECRASMPTNSQSAANATRQP